MLVKKSNYIEIYGKYKKYLNIIQAEKLNCDIITVTPEIFNKNKIKNTILQIFNRNL